MPPFLLSFLLRGAPYAAGAILITLIGTYVHHKGYAAGTQEVQAKLDAYRTEQTRQLLAAEQAAREKEREWSRSFADIDTQHQEAMKNAQAEYQKMVAAAHADTVRVRDNRATVCAAVSAASAAADTGAPTADPGSTSQLSRTDAGVLLQWGAEADFALREAIDERNECTALLQRERQ